MSTALYSYYGDDFTGSTDVLEALATAGLRVVLFLGVPSEEQRGQFADCQAFGIAGDSRSRPPEWMDEHLPGIFAQLRAFGAPIVHYKTCSTFDSSPRVGSIGRAMDIGHRVFPHGAVPIVVAAPHLRRYVVFGNLFAAAGSQVYRIDRHPTMRQHPVTPMYEADLRRHLAQQTSMVIGSIELPVLQMGCAEEELEALDNAGAQAVLFDGVGEGDAVETGRVIWRRATAGASDCGRGGARTAMSGPMFAVGSSGLTYSLVAAWREDGLEDPGAGVVGHADRQPGTGIVRHGDGQPRVVAIWDMDGQRGVTANEDTTGRQGVSAFRHADRCPAVTAAGHAPARADGVAVGQANESPETDIGATRCAGATGRPGAAVEPRVLVVSGSCSPATERQIKYALAHGYQGIAIDAGELLGDGRGEAAVEAYVERTVAALRDSGKVVVYSSLGPLPTGATARGDKLGKQLGRMLRDILGASGVRRVVLAGGDTSSHAVAQLGLYALTWAASIEPGAPLCRAHSESPELDGLELVLKGGQVGGDDFFERVRVARL